MTYILPLTCPSYWQTAVANLRKAEEQSNVPTLFDEAAS